MNRVDISARRRSELNLCNIHPFFRQKTIFRYTGCRILLLSHCDTYIGLWHYFANTKSSQKCRFITVGLSPCAKVSS